MLSRSNRHYSPSGVCSSNSNCSHVGSSNWTARHVVEMVKLSARVLVPRASERLPRGKNVALHEWFIGSPTWQCSDRRRISAGGILAVDLRDMQNANSEKGGNLVEPQFRLVKGMSLKERGSACSRGGRVRLVLTTTDSLLSASSTYISLLPNSRLCHNFQLEMVSSSSPPCWI